MPGPVGRLVKLIGSGIGLAAEALEARKNRSRSSSAVEAVSSSSTGDRIVELPEERAAELISQGRAVPVDGDEKKPHSKEDDDSDSLREDDEDEWELDDVAAELDPPSYEESERQQSVDELVRGVVQTAPATPSTRTKLPCPVIIPQRRPKDKGRGFVRAYAPVLNDSGVDQATFLQFLKSFHQASKASHIKTFSVELELIPNGRPHQSSTLSSLVPQWWVLCLVYTQWLLRRSFNLPLVQPGSCNPARGPITSWMT